MSAEVKSSSKAASRSTPCDPGLETGGEKLKTEDQKRTKRRRFYALILKREIGKAQKARNYNLEINQLQVINFTEPLDASLDF